MLTLSGKLSEVVNVLVFVWMLTMSWSLSGCWQCLGVCLGVGNVLESLWLLSMSWSLSVANLIVDSAFGVWLGANNGLGFCLGAGNVLKYVYVLATSWSLSKCSNVLESVWVLAMSWSLSEIDDVLEFVWVLAMSCSYLLRHTPYVTPFSFSRLGSLVPFSFRQLPGI